MAQPHKRYRRRSYTVLFADFISWMGIALVLIFLFLFLVLFVRHNLGLIHK